MKNKEKIQLPENASRPLKPGERYESILKPQNLTQRSPLIV